MTALFPPGFASAAAWLDDHLGAILVKEARQAVRSRFVVSVQFLFLAVLVVTLAVVLLGSSGGQLDRGAGRDVFVALNVMLHTVCVGCVPLYVGVRLAAERGDANVDLMFSTTLRPWSIVLGKAASGLLVGLLAVSACAPFMVLCYFLRGVDVATIVFCIGVDLVFLVLATFVAVFIGALPVGWVIKGIVALAYLALACFSVGGLGYEMARAFTRHGVVTEVFMRSEAQVAVGLCAVSVLAATGLFFVVTAALIASPTANRALPVRAYLSGLWVVSGGVVAALLLEPTYRREAFGFVVFGWAVAWSCVLALALVVAGSERDELGARMRRCIPESSLKRKPAFLFYSGSAGGLAWSMGMALLTLGAAWGGGVLWKNWVGPGRFTYERFADWFPRGLAAVGLGLCMVLAYVLLASGIRRHLLGRITRSIHTGVIAVGLMVAGILLPLLASFLLHGGKAYRIEKEHMVHAFNPFALFAYAFDNEGQYGPVAMICTTTTVFMLAVGVALSGVWLLRQAEAFGVVGAPGGGKGERA